MKRLILALSIAVVALPGLAAATVQKKEILSPVYTVDRKYLSMEGPMSTAMIRIDDDPAASPELVWVTAVNVVMMQEDGSTPTLPELMCHVNLDIDLDLHRRIFGTVRSGNARILTLSQGQLTSRYPEGFGLPLLNTEPLWLTTQVLNHNLENPNLKVRHKVTIEYVRDRDLKTAMKPVYNTGIFGMALVEGDNGLFGKPLDAKEEHGASCLMRPQAPNAMGASHYEDGYGRKFTGHWTVKPGREVNRTNVTKFLGLPFDTTLHAAAVHLHPFAESLELRDLTTGESLFKSVATNQKDKVGLVDVTSFASAKGITLKRDHEYELVSVYNNTTKENQDSMAVMYLSPLDRGFRKPGAAELQKAARVVNAHRLERQRLELVTAEGSMIFQLLPETAPATVEQILKLVSARVYDGIEIGRLEPSFIVQTTVASAKPLSEQQKSLLKPLRLEASEVAPTRGMLILGREDANPDSGESSFGILLSDAPHLKGKYTIFGQIETGLEILDKFERIPTTASRRPIVPIQILQAKIIER